MTNGHSAASEKKRGGRASETATNPNADAIIERLVVLRPWLRGMQSEAERQRRIPQETVERLDAAGIYNLTTPPRFGGADFSAKDLFRIYDAFGRGCGATAWTACGSTPSPP